MGKEIINLRKGFEKARICNDATDWEEDLYFYSEKNINERMEGLTSLVNQYIFMFNLPERLEKSIAKPLVKFDDETA